MAEHGGEHIVSPTVYVIIWITLLIFTGLTTWVAFQNFGVLNPIIALVIAFTKASLVVLFFMHVKYSSRMIALVVGCGLFFLSILIALSCSDYVTRRFS
jgi:cytochrome c oxidase subunit IV